MIELFIINYDSPIIDVCKNEKSFENYNVLCNSIGIEGKRELLSACSRSLENSLCKCLQKTSVPLKPKTLPFAPTPENNPKMKELLITDMLTQLLIRAPTELSLAFQVLQWRSTLMKMPRLRFVTSQQQYHFTGRRRYIKIS